MSEKNYVELPVMDWLCGEAGAPEDERGLGWTRRSEKEMEVYGRPLEDALVEELLVAAILRINPAVRTNAQAKLALDALRKTMSHPDKLIANQQTLDLLRDGARVELVPGEDAKTVQFIAFDPARQPLNDYTTTNQYRVQGVRQCREDTVMLVNGIPLVIAEYKSYVASGRDWREAVHQLHRYQRQAPLILVPNVFCFAADEEEFHYGTVHYLRRTGGEDAGADPGEHHVSPDRGGVAGFQNRRELHRTHRRPAFAFGQGGGTGGGVDRRVVGRRPGLPLPSAGRTTATAQGAKRRER